MEFFLGLIIGATITALADGVLYFNKRLRSQYWNNPKTFHGYHIHHSVLGIILIIASGLLMIFGNEYSFFLFGLGVGIIVVHTIMDGRLIFIEKKKQF